MKHKSMEAYCYYKKQYPGVVIFFRVNNKFEAYHEDAELVSTMVDVKVDHIVEGEDRFSKVSLPADDIFDYMTILASSDIVSKLIVQKNNDGEYALPDVQEIMKNRLDDYL